MENLKNKLVIIFIRGLEPVKGILLEISEKWVLLAHNPVDYVVEGYLLLNKEKIRKWEINEETEFTENIIKMKQMPILKQSVKFNLIGIEPFIFFKENSIMLAITFHKENVFYVGKLKNIDNKKIVLETLSTKCKWLGDEKFNIEKIRYINFYDDYTLSLNNFLISTSRPI